MFNFLNIWKPIGIFGGIAAALLLAWGMRVDHLRAGYKSTLDTIVIAFTDMGEKIDDGDYGKIVVSANKVGAERSRYLREREQERAANVIMADSVRRAGQETEEALKRAAEYQRRVSKLTKERDQWIAKAREASTRTERMTAEKEVAECTDALSELWRRGF